MTESAEEQPTSKLEEPGSLETRDDAGRFKKGNKVGFQPGVSGNPKGRRPGASFSAALARAANASIRGREELERIARMIGVDPDEARSIDLVSSLFFLVLCRLLLKAAERNGRTDDRLVGMLQLLLRALDPPEVRISGPGGGPIPIAVAIANVQAALGMQSLPSSGGDPLDIAHVADALHRLATGEEANPKLPPLTEESTPV